MGGVLSSMLVVAVVLVVALVAGVGVKDQVSMVKVWRSGKGEYKIFLWKK